MLPQKGDIIDITISDLAFGGAGVGKIILQDGEFVVFVEHTVPGDRVSARLTKIKKQYAEAKLEKIIEPSKDRIQARCKHFGVCGGCGLQFLTYENQLAWKEKMVSDALRQIGGFKNLAIEPIIRCADPWFYRNKMEYTFGMGRLGLHPKNNYREVFDLEECFLESPLSVEILCAVREWAKREIPDMAIMRNLIVREGKNTGEIMLNLVINGTEFPLDAEFTRYLCGKFPAITSLYRTSTTVERGRRTEVKEFHLYGEPTLTEKLTVGAHTLTFDILPQAFFQPNTKQAEVLYGKILEFAEAEGTEKVLDLFCGTGTIGMFFAKLGCRVIGIDSNASAIENAKKNAVQNRLSTIDFLCKDIDKFLFPQYSSLIPHPSLLITDPPRAGIFPKALEKIINFKIPRWIYVSCNPTTLARDLKIICEGGRYQIKKIQPIDMFPHTYHMETVCRLDLEGKLW